MKKQLPKRSEVQQNHTWDVHTIYKNDEAFNESLLHLEKLVASFVETYEKNLKDAKSINNGLNDLKVIYELITSIGAYASLQSATDGVSEINQIKSGKTSIRLQKIYKAIDFFDNELKKVSKKIVLEAIKLDPSNALYLEEMLKDKKHSLKPEAEKLLTALSPVL